MKKSFALVTISAVTFLALTSFASAQATSAGIQGGMGTLADIIKTFNETVVKALGALIMSGAVVAFFYGLAHFIWGLREGDPKVITNGKQFMIWSLTALFVMFSVYGIIKFFQGTLLPGASYNITIPEVNYGGGSSGSPVGSGGTDGSSGSPVGAGGAVGSSGSPVGSGGSSPSTGDAICLAYGPGTGCTTKSGLIGVCDASNICQPNNNE